MRRNTRLRRTIGLSCGSIGTQNRWVGAVRTFNDGVIMKIVRACGHTFIMDWLNSSSTIVDLGLNRGSFSTRMSRLVGCRIYGAEPDPVMFERLPEIPGLSKLQAAVCGEDGMVEFHVNSTQCSSML